MILARVSHLLCYQLKPIEFEQLLLYNYNYIPLGYFRHISYYHTVTYSSLFLNTHYMPFLQCLDSDSPFAT